MKALESAYVLGILDMNIVIEACKDVETARKFVSEVGKLAKKYNANYFIVTDGASGTRNDGNPAVRNARNAQIKWEEEHGFDPDEDWSKAEDSFITSDVIAEEGILSNLKQKYKAEFAEGVKNAKRMAPNNSKLRKEYDDEERKQREENYKRKSAAEREEHAKKIAPLKPQAQKIATFAKKLYDTAVRKYDPKHICQGARFDADYETGYIHIWFMDQEYKEYDEYSKEELKVVNQFFAIAEDHVDKVEEFIKRSNDIDTDRFRVHVMEDAGIGYYIAYK